MDIIPSILTNSIEELHEMIEKCEGVVDRVQIDVVDGVYAANKTLDPLALKYVDTTLKIDFHLMVANPSSWLEKCASVGADRVIAQIERMTSQEEFLQKAELAGVSAGFAVDLATSMDALDKNLVSDLSVLLLMSVPAGFGGQKFDTRVYEKIKLANTLREGDLSPCGICIDGGVDEENISTLFKLKVDEVAVGKSFFDGNLNENLDILLREAKA